MASPPSFSNTFTQGRSWHQSVSLHFCCTFYLEEQLGIQALTSPDAPVNHHGLSLPRAWLAQRFLRQRHFRLLAFLDTVLFAGDACGPSILLRNSHSPFKIPPVVGTPTSFPPSPSLSPSVLLRSEKALFCSDYGAPHTVTQRNTPRDSDCPPGLFAPWDQGPFCARIPCALSTCFVLIKARSSGITK